MRMSVLQILERVCVGTHESWRMIARKGRAWWDDHHLCKPQLQRDGAVVKAELQGKTNSFGIPQLCSNLSFLGKFMSDNTIVHLGNSTGAGIPARFTGRVADGNGYGIRFWIPGHGLRGLPASRYPKVLDGARMQQWEPRQREALQVVLRRRLSPSPLPRLQMRDGGFAPQQEFNSCWVLSLVDEGLQRVAMATHSSIGASA
ncbi:hypothetical protein CPB84DRAFT_1747279 [Gymnopilus junonius]|uniref:Uncharacterized protein n=1 Tax=Gymnopilus junonius TaxID=109634 RepID=A0A9P5TN43_GYMJU|nr:hypothetical protein CPB84DRAFT_1747279 [Gymnopilus junonius]